MSMFIGRKEEMEKLNEIYASKRAELVLLYGRRRVGKSRLLVESIKGRNALYFLADLSENILDVMASQIDGEFVKFSTWDDFFEFILKSKYEIFVIDEFQYLYGVNKAWPSILQRWWEKLKETNKKIVLCGSIISTIYKIALGYGSALYGRKTCEMEIHPLNFKDVWKFFPKYSLEKALEAYFILGGIPRYIEEFDSNVPIEENIKQKIIDKTSYLYNEPINLLFEEFRDFTPYISILLAITEGKMKFNEISDYSRIGNNKLPKYLAVLERVKIISKEIPVTEKRIKSKTTRYIVTDYFYKFWFRFIFKNKSRIEQGNNDLVSKDISRDINSYFGLLFEEYCRGIVNKMGIIEVQKVGRWWNKDKEIDVVAISESKEIFLGECKWSSMVNADQVIAELAEKSKFIHFKSDTIKYGVFAKSFSKKIAEFEGHKVYCIDLNDIEGRLKVL